MDDLDVLLPQDVPQVGEGPDDGGQDALVVERDDGEVVDLDESFIECVMDSKRWKQNTGQQLYIQRQTRELNSAFQDTNMIGQVCNPSVNCGHAKILHFSRYCTDKSNKRQKKMCNSILVTTDLHQDPIPGTLCVLRD